MRRTKGPVQNKFKKKLYQHIQTGFASAATKIDNLEGAKDIKVLDQDKDLNPLDQVEIDFKDV